jgi:hypothetical protein
METTFRTIDSLRAAFTNDLEVFAKDLDKFINKKEPFLEWKLSQLDIITLCEALFHLEEEMQWYEEDNGCKLIKPKEYRILQREYRRRTGSNWIDDKEEIYIELEHMLDKLSDYPDGHFPAYMCVFGYTALEEWAFEDELGDFYYPEEDEN